MSKNSQIHPRKLDKGFKWSEWHWQYNTNVSEVAYMTQAAPTVKRYPAGNAIRNPLRIGLPQS